MKTVIVEAGKGRSGVAQCRRCQAFRHTARGCRRPTTCVRCGGQHEAKECQRPFWEPPTCAHCRGPHQANSYRCPVYVREAAIWKARAGQLNNRAGAALPAATAAPVEEGHAANTLMAAANDGRDPHRKRRKPRRKKKKPVLESTEQGVTPSEDGSSEAVATPKSTVTTSTEPAAEDTNAVIEQLIPVLQEMLSAVRTGQSPVPILGRIAELQAQFD